MFRYRSERALRVLANARLVAYLAIVPTLVIVLASPDALGWSPIPAGWGGIGLAVIIAGYVVGSCAEHEQWQREDDDELLDALGHWPRQHEREDADVILAAAADAEPVAVDDEGEAVR